MTAARTVASAAGASNLPFWLSYVDRGAVSLEDLIYECILVVTKAGQFRRIEAQERNKLETDVAESLALQRFKRVADDPVRTQYYCKALVRGTGRMSDEMEDKPSTSPPPFFPTPSNLPSTFTEPFDAYLVVA